MIRITITLISLLVALSCVAQKKITLSKGTLQDKIKGGWAGQVIGVTYGGPTEFRYQGTMVNEYQPIPWYDGYIKENMINNAGLYDDLYMDLTFVEVLEREGLNAPAASHANAYAQAGYMLWHANQAGRYNILHGIPAPQSGHWKNNPHADDIDFQIEADFSGLMSPGMPNEAAKIGDSIGHIMNYGDGWYGGVYMAAMYSLAFTSNNVNEVVNEGLKTIPSQSSFYKCIADVIRWHKQYPKDWKQTWFELQKKWSDENGCPDGVFRPFNIDAKLNAAYVVLGLLYGEGNYTKTMLVSTHAGQDSDCNPSSAGGILGTMLGYQNIPEYWKLGLHDAEGINFKYTQISLAKVYELSFKHALKVIERTNGTIENDRVTILTQTPVPVRFEQSFPELYPTESKNVNKAIENDFTASFEGTAVVVRGEARPKSGSSWDYPGTYSFFAEIYIDDVKTETADLPVRFTLRRHELTWKYDLPEGKHTIKIRVLNPHADYVLFVSDILVYGKKHELILR